MTPVPARASLCLPAYVVYVSSCRLVNSLGSCCCTCVLNAGINTGSKDVDARRYDDDHSPRSIHGQSATTGRRSSPE
eukprot:45436-Eustigmatos_ZCMA.PRE.1